MKLVKRSFQEELEKVATTIQDDFSKQLEKVLNLHLESFQTRLQKEMKDMVKQMQYDNFKQLQKDIFDTVFLNNISIEQLLKKLSRVIISKAL